MSQKNIFKQLAGQTAVYGLSSVVGRLINYLLLPVYAYTLATQAEFGIYAELYAYAGFILVILTHGMETSFFRFHAKAQDQDKPSIFNNAFSSIGLLALVFLISVFSFRSEIAGLIAVGDRPYETYILLLALILALDAISAIPFAYLRAKNKSKLFAKIKLLNIGVNIGLTLYFFLLAPLIVQNFNLESGNTFIPDIPNVIHIVLANLGAVAIQILVLVFNKFIPKPKLTFTYWKPMFNYGWPILIAGLAGIMNEVIDRPMLKYLLPYSLEENMNQVGIYSACYRLSIIITLFIQAFRFAAEPFFFNRADKSDAKSSYASILRVFTAFCCLMTIGITLNLEILQYLIAPGYRDGLLIVPFLLFANTFLGIFFNLSVTYKLTNKTYLGAIIAILGATITIILNILFIPKFGYLGSAYATLICYFTMVVISYFIGKKIYPINYPIKRIVTYLLFAAGIVILYVRLIQSDNQFLNIFLGNCLFVCGIIFYYLLERNSLKQSSVG